MRILFMGASDLGWECCRTLLEIGQDIVGIFSIPQQFRISWSEKPVKNVRFRSFDELAKGHGIPLIYITKRMSDPEYREVVQGLKPDMLIVIGWYYMIPGTLRELAPLGAAGIHASLLPKYRGGAPLVWAMIKGERQAGVSFFYFADGVDDGDLIAQAGFDIAFEDDISSVIGKATTASLQLLREYVPLLSAGQAPCTPQDHSQATVVPQRKPEDGLIEWQSMSAVEVYNWIRAQTHPYPGAFTFLEREKVTIWRSSPANISSEMEAPPGTILADVLGPEEAFGVHCADGQILWIHTVGLVNGSTMSGAEFIRARGAHAETVFGCMDSEQSYAQT